MRKGLEAIVKKNPDSITAMNELGYLSYQAKDHACAQVAFGSVGNSMDTEIWNGDTARFLRFKGVLPKSQKLSKCFE
jgi:hypothetical protein